MKQKITFLVLACMLLIIVSTFGSALNISNKKSISSQSNLSTLDSGKNCAVVIAGGVGWDLQQHTWDNTGRHAERTFQSKGYNVKLLMQPTKNEAYDAINSWLPNTIGLTKKDVVLYIVDHGTRDEDSEGLILNPDLEILSPSELAIWVDMIQNKCNILTIVIDACYSGQFIQYLSGYQRIIITATDHDSVSITNSFRIVGEAIFSNGFLDALDNGKSYGEAWEAGDRVIDRSFWSFFFPLVNPQIDDNGDGVGSGTWKADDLDNLADGDLAMSTNPSEKSKSINTILHKLN